MAQQSMPDAHNAASPAQFDDLFDYDVDLDGILQDASTRSNTNPSRAAPGPDAPGLGLGLDDEVKVTKTRKPVAKLDENRLLSQAGVPKLRRTSRQKLKFKGKGHEFSDAARLLNFYQLWLDDLFPRAKFTDGLAIVEKLGHSKRMQTMRREWIDEEKPRQQIGSDQQDQETKADRQVEPSTTSNTFSNLTPAHSGQQHRLSLSPRPSGGDNGDLFVPDNSNTQPAVEENGPEYDDLEALLQEQENDTRPQIGLSGTGQNKQSIDRDLFADELEVMEELDIPN